MPIRKHDHKTTSTMLMMVAVLFFPSKRWMCGIIIQEIIERGASECVCLTRSCIGAHLLYDDIQADDGVISFFSL
jgi:hypothetical protein